jgi:hypothetical protein
MESKDQLPHPVYVCVFWLIAVESVRTENYYISKVQKLLFLSILNIRIVKVISNLLILNLAALNFELCNL